MPITFAISAYRSADRAGIQAIYPELLEESSSGIEKGTLLVAQQGGHAIGFVLIVWHRNLAHFDSVVTRWGEIEELHVHKDYQTRGVGTSLMMRALQEARRRKCEAVYVVTDDFNSRARSVYEKCGFSQHNLVIRYKYSLH